MKNNQLPPQQVQMLADRIMATMQGYGLTPDEMLQVLAVAKQKIMAFKNQNIKA